MLPLIGSTRRTPTTLSLLLGAEYCGVPLWRTSLGENDSAETNLEHHSSAAADCRALHLHLPFCRGRPCPGLHLTNRPPCTVPMVTQGQMVSPSWGVIPAFGTAQRLCFSCEFPPRKRVFHGSLSTGYCCLDLRQISSASVLYDETLVLLTFCPSDQQSS